MPKPQLVTFDVYMALLDIEGSLVPQVAETLGLTTADARPFVQLWRARQMERAAASNTLQLGRLPFRAATAMALDYCLARHGIEADAATRAALVRAWDALKPWSEAEAAVAAVKAKGCQTAILSNGDQDMLEAVAGNFAPGTFDHILSSEMAGHYKPHPAVYHLPTAALGIAKHAVVHVAGSAGDVMGAVAAGMTCIWSNRHRDRVLDPAYPPTHEIADLAGVAGLIAD